MIGGIDVIIPANGEPTSLDNCAQVVRHHWSGARFEDAVTGDKYASYANIPFGHVRELFAYRSAQAEAAWDADCPDSLQNSMIYLILSPQFVTAVLDDPSEPEMRSILDSMRYVLRNDILNTYAEAA